MKRLQSAETRRSVKLDYSDTYLENEILETELDSKIVGIHKARYKASVDRDEGLEKARREAEEIQKLSEAVKKQGPRDDYLQDSKPVKKSVPEIRVTESSLVKEDVAMNITEQSEKTDHMSKDSDDESEDGARLDPVNIAMFKLNIKNFRRKLSDAKVMNKSNDIAGMSDYGLYGRKSQSAQVSISGVRRRPDILPPRFLRPRTMKPRKAKEGEVLEAVDVQPIMVYGVHVKKHHNSRSRRELQEMSKIQQEEKFGKPDRRSEEKKKVEAWAKGDGALELRIKKFMDDIEAFKKRERESEFPLLQMVRSASTVTG